MEVTYDDTSNCAYVKLVDGMRVEHTREITPHVMVDFSSNGDVVGVESVSATQHGFEYSRVVSDTLVKKSLTEKNKKHLLCAHYFMLDLSDK